MAKIIWLSCALAAMAALLGFYFTAKKRMLRLSAKGGATGAALATAVFCHLQGGSLPAGGIILAAIALFVLADVLLDLKFLWGVAAFALGHAALIIWLFEQETARHHSPFSFMSFSIAALLYALSVFSFRKALRRAGKKAFALLLYAAVLSLMTGVSLMLPHLGDMRYLPFTLGACLFMVSDLFVARGILIGIARKWHILTMILYESAVLLMALCA